MAQEKLDEAKRLYKTANSDQRYVLERLFPELTESDDEKIRKGLLYVIEHHPTLPTEEAEEYIAWLEKQGEQKSKNESADTCDSLIIKSKEFPASEKRDFGYFSESAGKVELKFKVGDWIIDNNIKTPFQITGISNEKYDVISIYGTDMAFSFREVEHFYHLWTIQDAKDGDVLSYVTDEEDLWIMIYWSLYEPYEGHVHYHALLVNNNFSDKGTCCICIDNLKPATKEQCDALEKAMADAGYTFDFEKKDMKKIEQKPGWSEEDEYCTHQLIVFCENCMVQDVGAKRCAHWLKSLKDRVGCEVNCTTTKEWSEGDEELYKKVETAINSYYAPFSRDAEEMSEWFKNLKNKVQPQSKQEWDEEDCIYIETIACHLDNIGNGTMAESLLNIMDKYKSLRPQNTWKPSDEQMEALEHFIVYHNGSTNYAKDLEELRLQLKKL